MFNLPCPRDDCAEAPVLSWSLRRSDTSEIRKVKVNLIRNNRIYIKSLILCNNPTILLLAERDDEENSENSLLCFDKTVKHSARYPRVTLVSMPLRPDTLRKFGTIICYSSQKSVIQKIIYLQNKSKANSERKLLVLYRFLHVLLPDCCLTQRL